MVFFNQLVAFIGLCILLSQNSQAALVEYEKLDRTDKKQSIHLLYDIHFLGDLNTNKKQQDSLIRIGRSLGSKSIFLVEDMLSIHPIHVFMGYKLGISSFGFRTPLSFLSSACTYNGLECFNVEFRSKSTYRWDHEFEIVEDFSEIRNEELSYANFHYPKIINLVKTFYEKNKDKEWVLSYESGRDNCVAIDLRFIRAIQNNPDKAHIFIVAGNFHTQSLSVALQSLNYVSADVIKGTIPVESTDPESEHKFEYLIDLDALESKLNSI